MKKIKILYGGIAVAILTTILISNAAAADPIADLNLIAETTIKTAGHPLPVTAVEYAIVQLAVYDAVGLSISDSSHTTPMCPAPPVP